MSNITPKLDALPRLRVNECFITLFAPRIREQRITKGLSQHRLCICLQTYGIYVSQGYISRLESGQRKDPSIAIIIALSIILDISIDQIINLTRDLMNE
ncbi:MAG: helix-turn-helix domain-containing protein [Chloroflexi bacterium]|nr:helix-turn-helix domain-containing protein [Chloroflexota bacterium]